MRSLLLLSVLLLPCPAFAAPAPKIPATAAAEGRHHHPVSTRSPEAQRTFDLGMTQLYAFNHDEAIAAFRRAAQHDPQLAMAHWGIALALGPNINLDVDPEREKAAYDAVRKALTLAAGAPPHERAYIETLARRYSADPKADLKLLAVAYRDAMGDLMRRYPDDLDAATLYAEAGMDLRPWKLWTPDGKPEPGTEDIVAVLESVLARDPNHIGANHYYIHAVEASRQPERALSSAERLKTLVPDAGHLVHMPAHVYIRTGDYAASARANTAGAKADEAYMRKKGAAGVYPAMYYSHNLHFLAVAEAMQGRYSEAQAAARKLAAHVKPQVKDMPMLEFFLPTADLLRVRFHRWDDVRKQPEPDRRAFPVTHALWVWTQGVAEAAEGHVAEARELRDAFAADAQILAADATWDLNPMARIMVIARNLLDARLAWARHEVPKTLELLRAAVAAEDALAYTEPPSWYLPVREALGGALLTVGQPEEAERVFRADLERNPRSGRSLFGLRESLQAQDRTYEAAWVDRQFREAWRNADGPLKRSDLF